MEYRQIGDQRLRVSAVGLGVWQWGSKGYWRYGEEFDKKDIVEIITAAKEEGINFIDTAEVYGRGESERLVGELVPKKDFIIATKFLPLTLTSSSVHRHAEKSLKRLKLSTIDLYQVHVHNPLLSLKGTMKQMERLVKEGKIRHIGVSNFDVKTLERAREFLSKEDIVSNQIHYSLITRGPEKNGMLDYCSRNKITIITWSPLEQGVLTGKYPPGSRIKGWRKTNSFFHQSNLKKVQPFVRELREASEAHGKTTTQGALTWLLKDKNVVVIPGAKKADQVRMNAGGVGWEFTDSELLRLDGAYASYFNGSRLDQVSR